MLGDILPLDQSLFVPRMLTASNRAAERDMIKDEADHRAWTHLCEANEELRLLKLLALHLDGQSQASRNQRRR